jgi:hypothetical protein
LGPTEGREEKWSISFWKDFGNIIKLKAKSEKLKVIEGIFILFVLTVAFTV